MRARASQSIQPAIISRTEWGGDSVPPRSAPEYGEVQAAFVHHTVTANDYGPEDSAGIVLGIARYHRDSNGWNDIGYNFLVDQYGQVFEGRAGGIDQAVIGAQAQGYNSASTGIADDRDVHRRRLSRGGDGRAGAPDRLEALAARRADRGPGRACPRAAARPTAIRSGTPVTLERICGHRDGDSTSCPGDTLYAQLPDLRARASRYAGPLAGITVRAATRRIRTRPVELSGELRFPDGSSPAAAPLQIQFAVPGATFAPVADTACGPDGRWAASVPLTQSGSLRAAFVGDATRPPLASSPIAIRVLPTLRMRLSSRRLPAGRNVAVSGTVFPRPTTGRVEVRVERRVGRRWRRVQRKRVNVRGGRYLTKLRMRTRGLYRVSVRTPGATQRRLLRIR